MPHVIQIAVIIAILTGVVWRMVCDLRAAWPTIVRLSHTRDVPPVTVRFTLDLYPAVAVVVGDPPHIAQIPLAA